MVGRGVDRDRLEAFFMTCANDSKSDLAAIGDEDAFYGRHAGGGVSPKTSKRLLQRRELNRAALS